MICPLLQILGKLLGKKEVQMSQVDYPGFAWRWAMKKQEVILKAIAGEIKWIQAADILCVSARTIRRMKESYQ